jgi:hypothetical protein
VSDPTQILTCSCGAPKATITEPYRGSLDRRDVHVCPECDGDALRVRDGRPTGETRHGEADRG